ncbi:glycoside hydrolase family 9 protein [Flavivirga spongiicola]|uniref:Glycoside hydrolase family 9 protein n=1 Tax=Flavivirga spongiicola TaxID=421621 RepID=A0ABU7XM89_9FLAO|nr:glycoside hydrolase family 9 protein [Flavivirga sp. MEBiC05379]MDO5981217.1 glycoside hydrolase family 9 protein [Flavivirga sp. MEBiC05379]
MNKSITIWHLFAMLIIVGCNKPKVSFEAILLLNHTGYNKSDFKNVVFQTKANVVPEQFQILDQSNTAVFKGLFKKGGQIDNWNTGNAFVGDFSKFNVDGEYTISTSIDGLEFKSRLFKIDNKTMIDKGLELLIEGFESQHPEVDFEKKDSKMTFFGARKDTVDVHGGWYDASGDKSKYFSHLCYSNFMPPQQTPIFVWNLMESISKYKQKENVDKNLVNRMLKETTYGADFLMRMQDELGYFYLTIFDNWSGDPERREICAYKTQDGIRSDLYKAAFREGGGIAIAALARASQLNSKGEYSRQDYLTAAIKGFNHLIKNNNAYTDDGTDNIIDDYCALIAATELFVATKESSYLDYARKRMTQLTNRLSSDENYSGWWQADDTGNRPYFHAVEAGLPLIALARFLEFETDENFRNTAINAIQKSFDFEVKITSEVNNPFGYPRQYVKAINENKKRAAFFIPHQNETGYWWQGENSRLASYASAFYMVQPYLTEQQKPLAIQLATNNINWILGLNPYDICMVDGIGFNNPDYFIENDHFNFKGGVANGITSGFTDETDIAYMPDHYKEDPAQNWRWAEQWMPHGSWFMLAITSIKE